MFEPSFVPELFTAFLDFFTNTPFALVTTIYILILCCGLLRSIFRLFR